MFNSGVSRGAVATAIVNGLESIQDQIKAAYQTFLLRAPDTASLQFWTATIIQSGTNALLNGILVSPEYFAHASTELPPNPNAPSIALAITNNFVNGFDSSVTLTVTVTPPAGSSAPPAGTVTLTDDDGTLLDTVTLVNGTAASKPVSLIGRNHTITATYVPAPNQTNLPGNTTTKLFTFLDENVDTETPESMPFDDATDKFI